MSSRRQHGSGAGGSVLPPLRFPEFRNSGPWLLRPIGEAVVESRVPAGNNDPQRRITVRLYGHGVEQREYRGTESTEATQHFIRRAGQFIYGKQNIHKGAMGIVPSALDGFQTSQDLPAFDFLAGISPKWFLYSIGQEQFYTALEHRMTGTGSKRLSEDVFRAIELPVPELDEQQKIADCLTSLDEVIAAQGRKVEALKAHKKGLMQHLFPQEGQALPRLRFPEFRGGPEWTTSKLDDLAKRGTGHTPDKSKPEYYDGGIKWVSLADSSRLDQGFIDTTEREVSALGIDNSSAVLHPAGSVLLSRDAGVGKSAVMKGQMAVSQHFIVWSCQPLKLANWFLYYTLQGLKPLFEQVATGSTIKTIGMPFFSALEIRHPSVAEQQRIADCLASLDAAIAAASAAVTTLKTHKAGLMQGLFPSMEGE